MLWNNNYCKPRLFHVALTHSWAAFDMTRVLWANLTSYWQQTQAQWRKHIRAVTPQVWLWLKRLHMSSAIQVIHVVGWLQNSVQPGWTFLLPLSLVWLSHAVTHCLSLGCLMVDANWPPFPLSSPQMKRFPPSCDGTCHNMIRQIKKLSAVTLSSFEALAS